LIVVRALLEKFGGQLSFSWYHPPKQGNWRGSFSVLFLYAKLQKNGGLCKENGVFNLRGRPVFSGLARGDTEAVLLDAEVMLFGCRSNASARRGNAFAFLGEKGGIGDGVFNISQY